MAQNGELVFFTEERPSEPKKVLGRLLALGKGARFVFASRTYEESKEWERFLKSKDDVEVIVEQPDVEESVGDDMKLEEFSSLYKDGVSLRITVGSCPFAGRVAKAIEESIAKEIRGDFCPGELIVTIGYHDIFECAENHEGFLFGRPFVSVSFWGYGTPNRWQAFRKEVFQIEEIESVNRELEAITGPLQSCVLWNV